MTMADSSDDDTGLTMDHDDDYFASAADKRAFQSFLNTNLEADGKPSKKQKTMDEIEEKHAEKRYLATKDAPDLHHMLPVKTEKGQLRERARVVEKQKPEETEEKQKEEEEEVVAPKSVAELYKLRRDMITKAKSDIARLCCAITEDPYNNLAAMKKLRAYCATEDSKAGQTIRKLAILSLTEIYNDILPSYRVKPAEDLETLSKEVKVQHSYETELLRNYRVFLDLLFENLNVAFQSKKKWVSASRKALGLLSLQSMCEMLVKNYNFNLRSNIVNTILPYGTSKAMNGQLADAVIKTITEILNKDKQGECSVEIVRQIAALIKKKGSNVSTAFLETLLHVRLVELTEVKREKAEEKLVDTATLSKKQRKHRKEQAKVRQELLEAEATESKKKLYRLQSESLDHIFVTFFRILKQFHNTPLLPSALKGLSKFAKLINVDFFTDLFECLKNITREEDLELADSLNCISTIFTILTGQGSVLDVDIGEFYALLYQNILLLTPSTPLSTFRTLRQTLTATIQRKVPLSAQMAMVKRLCTISVALSPVQAHCLMCEARKLIRGSPRLSQLLQSDEEMGVHFLPDLSEPGQARAEGTVLWELTLLARSHWDERVRKTGQLLSRFDPNSTKRSEVEYFMKEHQAFSVKRGCVEEISILKDDFPESCNKKMQNRFRSVFSDDIRCKLSKSEEIGMDGLVFFGS